MAYDEDVAYRIREALADQDGVTEKKMFGGLAFMVNAHTLGHSWWDYKEQ